MKERKSNFELLRILSMFLIVLTHCFEHTTWTNSSNMTSNILINITRLGNIGVICFMLITGYFQSNSKIKRKSLITLIIEVLFYSVTITIIFYFFNIGKIHVSILDVITSIFPIIFKKYWFITTYIIVYLLSPYLNKLIESLSKKEYQKFLLILTLIFSIIPTITTSTIGLTETGYLIYIYFIGAYIKKYNIPKINKKKYLAITLVCVLCYFLSVIAFSNFAYLHTKIYENIDYLFGLNKIPTLICSIATFLYFKELDIKNKKINKLASYTLGVYLIHDNPLIRDYLWNHLLKLDRYYNSPLVIVYGFLACIIIYLICSIIELLRKKMIEKRYLKLIK